MVGRSNRIVASYVAADPAELLDAKGMDHVGGAPHHPQTQGKIERWHQTMSYGQKWVTRPDQAALVSVVSTRATPSVNLMPSMIFGN